MRDDREGRLLVQALAAYSDSCTIPRLTPNCPFYTVGDEGPSCNEECRSILSRYQVPDRGFRTVEKDGLLMTGWAMPLAVATGAQPFDATQSFLEERELDAASQSTTALLLSLRSHLISLPFKGRQYEYHQYALELERRGIALMSVVRGSIMREIAATLTLVAFSPRLQSRALLSGYSGEFVARLGLLAESGWAQVFEACAQSERIFRAFNVDEVLGTGIEALHSRLLRPLDFGDQDAEIASVANTLPDGLRIGVGRPPALRAFFTRFMMRIENWLVTLSVKNFEQFADWRPPTPSVFMSLSPHPSSPDEIGLWIWDRFTVTLLDEWATSSILLEWRALRRVSAGNLPRKIWDERIVAADDLGKAFLKRRGQDSANAAELARGSVVERHVARAIDFLVHNDVDRAAEIFYGLKELSPDDGKYRNNYGFCLLPKDVSAALGELQHASLFLEGSSICVNIANRALALHLVGRNEIATRLLSETASLRHRHEDHPAVLWEHGQQACLTIQPRGMTHDYAARLLAHIRSGDCRFPLS